MFTSWAYHISQEKITNENAQGIAKSSDTDDEVERMAYCLFETCLVRLVEHLPLSGGARTSHLPYGSRIDGKDPFVGVDNRTPLRELCSVDGSSLV